MKTRNIIILSTLLFLLAINFLVFKSYRIQYFLISDNNQPSISFDSLNAILPQIPNITITAMPLDVYRSNYLLKEGRLSEAKNYIDKAIKVNPHVHVGDFFDTKIFLYEGKLDSAYFSSKKAFFGWSKNIDHYNAYLDVLEYKKDTLSLVEAYNFLSPDLKKRPEYFERFYKSLNKIKLSFLITKYEDATSIAQDSILGTWVRAYNFPGQVIYDSTSIYRFKRNNILVDVDGNEYIYNINNDSLFFSFKTNIKKPFQKVPIRYSPSFKTFILYNVPLERNAYQAQHYKKVN